MENNGIEGRLVAIPSTYSWIETEKTIPNDRQKLDNTLEVNCTFNEDGITFSASERYVGILPFYVTDSDNVDPCPKGTCSYDTGEKWSSENLNLTIEGRTLQKVQIYGRYPNDTMSSNVLTFYAPGMEPKKLITDENLIAYTEAMKELINNSNVDLTNYVTTTDLNEAVSGLDDRYLKQTGGTVSGVTRFDSVANFAQGANFNFGEDSYVGVVSALKNDTFKITGLKDVILAGGRNTYVQNLVAPTNDNDAATKAYVDAAVVTPDIPAYSLIGNITGETGKAEGYVNYSIDPVGLHLARRRANGAIAAKDAEEDVELTTLKQVNDKIAAITIPNASTDTVGGIKTYLDEETGTLYITTDGSNPAQDIEHAGAGSTN